MVNKKISILLVILAIVISIASSVLAVTSAVIDNFKKGSITLTAYEFVNGDINNKKTLSGAEFTIYKVTEDIQNVDDAEADIAGVTPISMTTGSDGKVVFSNLEIGRYYVKETNAPKNVLTKVESFLVDIPTVNSNGTAWEYDIVANPKNVTVYGNVTLTKNGNHGEAIKGAVYKLEKKVNNVWQEYDLGITLATNEEGIIEIQNLEAGTYRLVEMEIPNGYIADKSNINEFEIYLNNTDIVINTSNEIVEGEKYVYSSDGSKQKAIGAYNDEKITWEVDVKIPSKIRRMTTFKINENLGEGLKFLEDTLTVKGDDTTLTKNIDYTLSQEDNLVFINFITQKIVDFNNLEIQYKTDFNNNVEYGQELANSTTILYTNLIEENGNEGSKYNISSPKMYAETHTGKLLILKTNELGEALSGAEFKIATSEQNAKDGTFLENSQGEQIIAISDDNGKVVFEGLKYGEDGDSADEANSDYWIVEVQAPSYEEDGETKYYNLLKNPVKVRVNSYSGEASEHYTPPTIVNKKPFKLPATGALGIGMCVVVGLSAITFAIISAKKNDKSEQ